MPRVAPPPIRQASLSIHGAGSECQVGVSLRSLIHPHPLPAEGRVLGSCFMMQYDLPPELAFPRLKCQHDRQRGFEPARWTDRCGPAKARAVINEIPKPGSDARNRPKPGIRS